MTKFPDIGTGENMSSQLDRAKQYIDAVFEMKVQLREAEIDVGRCTEETCKEQIFFVEGLYAVTNGHVYSKAGVREVGITGWCEWCFDKATKIEEDDELTEAQWEQYRKDLEKQSILATEPTDPYEEDNDGKLQ